MRIGKRQLNSTAEVPWTWGQRASSWEVAEKAARLRGPRLALQGQTDGQKWLPTVALGCVGRVGRWGGGGKGRKAMRTRLALRG